MCLCANLFMGRTPFIAFYAFKCLITQGVINKHPPLNKKKPARNGEVEEGGMVGGRV